mgnify:CR=1 FL=1
MTMATVTLPTPNFSMRVSASRVAAPESTMSLPITAPKTTMIASEPRVEPNPVWIVSKSSAGPIRSRKPIVKAAMRSDTMALTLNFMLSTSMRAMPSTTPIMCIFWIICSSGDIKKRPLCYFCRSKYFSDLSHAATVGNYAVMPRSPS